MSTTNKRELVLEHIRNTTIPLINGTGNYDLNIQTVSRELIEPTDLKHSKLPVVMILDDILMMHESMTNNEYTTGVGIPNLDFGMPIGLIGYVKIKRVVKRDLAGALSTEMNKMRKDLIIAMHDDISLGSNCLAVVLKSSLNSLQYAESQELGIVVLQFAIKYDFNPQATNPSV